MTGVAIEQMLELWCVELRQVKADLIPSGVKADSFRVFSRAHV